MALFNRPWVATGDMFITAEGMTMIQQSPTQILTRITANTLEYYDVDRDVRRSMHLKQAFAVPGMAPFLQMLYLDKQQGQLSKYYTTAFSHDTHRWQLLLTPATATADKIMSVTLSGPTGRGPDLLKLEYTDGDLTEWRMTLLAEGQAVTGTLQKALEKINREDDFAD